MSGLLLLMVLSVRTCWFHDVVSLPSPLVLTDFGTVHGHASVRCAVLPMLLSIC
jgi:hypothetical protein